MKRVFFGAGLGAMLLVFAMPITAQHDDGPMRELEQCRELDGDDQRLSCYDRIGETPSVVAATTVKTETSPVVDTTAAIDVQEQDSQYVELTDDIGLPKKAQPADDYNTVLATISRCELASNRIFYFYFENGQIWKYIGRKQLKYRDCSGEAEIKEDRFGFELQLDGETRSVRVARVK